MISLATILTNNNLFVIVSIKLIGNMWDIYSEQCFKTHGDHEYDINFVLFFPYKMSLTPVDIFHLQAFIRYHLRERGICHARI